MAQPFDIKPANERELVFGRILDAPRDKVYRCWTEPALLTQWFCPKPWTTPRAEIDLRPGGFSHIVMQGPNGEVQDNTGQYLEVVPNQKLVFTDAFTGDWTPKECAPFMVAEITFADAGPGKTRYVARCRHWTAETAKQHEEMRFYPGWGQCAEQLEALAKTI